LPDLWPITPIYKKLKGSTLAKYTEGINLLLIREDSDNFINVTSILQENMIQ
jgi:hypothetical protein